MRRMLVLVGAVICVVSSGPQAYAAWQLLPGPSLDTPGAGITSSPGGVVSGSPNDPDYAGCEHQPTLGNAGGCTDSEQWDLYGPLHGNNCPTPVSAQPAVLPHPDGGLPCWAYAASDPQHAAGINMDGAWRQGNLGDGMLVAYIEGGVNYSNDGIKDGLDNIYLNRGELPWPENAQGLTKVDLGQGGDPYDLTGNGHFDIRDYARDPRVNPPCPPGVSPFVAIDVEGTTRSCLAGGQHQYVNSVNIGGKPTPYLSPEDLIAVFGHCQIVHGRIVQCPVGGHFDNDGNGYPNDISGWNFNENTNDPQTEDSAYSHAPGLISLIAGVADNGYAGVGVCPHCRVVPIRANAECLGRPDRWGESILYATDIGANAISSVVVEYAYSSFSQAAVDYAYHKGVLLSLDSNDFDSMDHTDGMLFDHAFPGNSLAEDKGGPAANATTWFRSRSNVTSYGTHNLFSGGEYTTSGATPFQASFLAMVQSAALIARQRGVIGSLLAPDEIKQVLIDTISPVIPQTQSPQTPRQWPGNPDSHTDATHSNWSTQYGYGRPDIGAATAAILAGRIPPTAEVSAPHWFAYVDPTRQPQLEVDGGMAPSRFHSGGSIRYTLEYALGANPADSDFVTVTTGTSKAAVAGRLGSIDLTRIPASYYTRQPGVTLQPDGPEQYTMTIRVRVQDANGLKAEDRRSIGLRHDPSLAPGFPKYIGGEAASDPTYADLEGRNQLDLILATYDGDVLALRPDGSEVTGYPVHSARLADIDPNSPQRLQAPAYSVPALRDVRDPLSGVAVGDLRHDGQLEVIATSDNADVYAWDAQGRPFPGFPVHSDPAYWTASVPTPKTATPHSRLPVRGNWSPPVLADLEGTGQLDVLMTGFDGNVYAWRPDGKPVPGWPVEVRLPQAVLARDHVDPGQYMRDPKLMYAVGVADVLGTGRPQVFVSSFESNGVSTATDNLATGLAGLGAHSNQLALAWVYGIWPDGKAHAGGPYLPNWPVSLPALAFSYDQSIDFVGEAASAPIFGDVDGSGKLRIVTTAVTGQVYVLNGDGSVYRKLDLTCASPDCMPNPPYRPTGDTQTITLTGQPSLGDLLGRGTPQVVQSSAGAESTLSALQIPGQAAVPQVYEKAWDPTTGRVLSGYPRRVDGFPFYAAPVIADVAGTGGRETIDSNDNGWIHAFGPDGREATGFPKYTGQWPGFSSAVGDVNMNGHLHLANASREGWVYDWQVGGKAELNNNWWHYRHDERNSGVYGLDTRRPAAVSDLGASPVRDGLAALAWTATGDDYRSGVVARYDVRVSAQPITDSSFWQARSVNGPLPTASGTRQSLLIPADSQATEYVAVRAVDKAGNISALSNVVCMGACARLGSEAAQVRPAPIPTASLSASIPHTVPTDRSGLPAPVPPLVAVLAGAALVRGLRLRRR